MKNKKPFGAEIEPEKNYTVSGGFGKGVVFFNKDGEEIGRKHFKQGEDSTSFISPKEAIGFKLLVE